MITSYLALALSISSFLFSIVLLYFLIETLTELKGFKKSTHQVQFVPAEKEGEDPMSNFEMEMKKLNQQELDDFVE